ncbi:MAG: hypothetical protein M1837_004487 [Sclerophora amabilis]|nr:MAG: hypothetical protein M1837_004487 [Sclerophora amabilis]
MSLSPSKAGFPLLPPADPSPNAPPQSPRTRRTIRKLQSAHNLSSNSPSANPPSLISQQRQQLQQLQQQHRTGVSSIPKDPASHSPVPQLHSAHGRSRSNSDAAVHAVSQSGSAVRRHALAKKVVAPAVSATRRLTLDGLVRDGPLGGDITNAYKEMRYLVLTDGVSSDTDGMSSLRIYIWLILLSAPPLATDDYLSLVHRGPSPAYAKIRNDTFRTLATDPLFRRRVSEASLIRLLNAVAWQLHDSKQARLRASTRSANTNVTLEGSPELQPTTPTLNVYKNERVPRAVPAEASEAGGAEPGTYVQGMNVLAAPFLYAARSEAEAFVAFHRFLTQEVPGYVRGAMDGVHRGLALVDKVLAIVDPKLSNYLLSKSMHAELYAFPSVLTLCACTPPLPEVLHLWDFLFAYGAHLNLLCIVAQLVMIRDTILESPSPTKILRSFPPLQATKVKMIAISLVRKIPDNVYDEIVMHAK